MPDSQLSPSEERIEPWEIAPSRQWSEPSAIALWLRELLRASLRQLGVALLIVGLLWLLVGAQILLDEGLQRRDVLVLLVLPLLGMAGGWAVLRHGKRLAPAPSAAVRLLRVELLPWALRASSRWDYRAVPRAWVTETRRWGESWRTAIRCGRRGAPAGAHVDGTLYEPSPELRVWLAKRGVVSGAVVCGVSPGEAFVVTAGPRLSIEQLRALIACVLEFLALADGRGRSPESAGAALSRLSAVELTALARESFGWLPALRGPAIPELPMFGGLGDNPRDLPRRAPNDGVDPTQLAPAVRAADPTDLVALAKQRRPHFGVMVIFYGSVMATFVLADMAPIGAWIAGVVPSTLLIWLIARQVWRTPPHVRRVVTPWGTRSVARFSYRGAERVWMSTTTRWRRPTLVALRVGRRGQPISGSQATACLQSHPALARRLCQMMPRTLNAVCGYDEAEVNILFPNADGVASALDPILWGLAVTEALDRRELDKDEVDLDREDPVGSEAMTSERLTSLVRGAWSIIPAIRAPVIGVSLRRGTRER